MAGPSAEEQYLLELVNDTRLNPLGDAARYLASFTPLVATQRDIQQALNQYQVNGAALQAEFAGLTPVQPVAWNESLAAAARAHDQAMIAADQQTHQAPGEADLGARDTAAGYTNWRNLGENVFAYADDPLYAHAGFVVDWGDGPNGIQSPPGHLENIMSADFREVGVGIVGVGTQYPHVGPEVVTEDFGGRFDRTSFVLGVAYTDVNGDDFYEPGEGVGSLVVSLGSTAVQAWASGGYTLETGATGAQTVVLSGGGLAGPVSVALNLAAQSDVKLDVVDGTELKTSASVAVSGPIGSIEGLGMQGLTLVATGTSVHAVTGGGGGDSIAGGDGGAFVRGLDGNDTVTGGAGADDLNGNVGEDIVVGGAGADSVRGGQGGDTVYGGLGDDPHVNGNLGGDIVWGGQGNDTVYGGQGDDTLHGDIGDDVASGDLGNDLLYGGAGADRFVLRPGFGQDRVADFSAADGDKVLLPTGTSYTVASDSSGEAVISLNSGDTLTLVGVSPAQMGDWLAYG